MINTAESPAETKGEDVYFEQSARLKSGTLDYFNTLQPGYKIDSSGHYRVT